jgi:hypothetical protein
MRVRSGQDTLKIRRFVNSGRTGSISGFGHQVSMSLLGLALNGLI